MKKTAFLLFLLVATLLSVSAASLIETGESGRGNEPRMADGSGNTPNTIPVVIIPVPDNPMTPVRAPRRPNPGIPFDGSGRIGEFTGDPGFGPTITSGAKVIYIKLSTTGGFWVDFNNEVIPSTVEFMRSNTGEYWCVPYIPGDAPVALSLNDCSGSWRIFIVTTSGEYYYGTFQIY